MLYSKWRDKMENQNNEIDLASELKKFNDSMLPFLKSLDAEMKQLKMTVQGLQEENHRLSKSVEKLREEKQQLSSEIDVLQNERRKFDGSCILLGAENKALEKNVGKLHEMNFERGRY